jgi:hypothetical protein
MRKLSGLVLLDLTGRMIPIYLLNVWFVPDEPWYTISIGPKGWDDSNGSDDTVHRARSIKWTAWWQSYLWYSSDLLILWSAGQSN